MTEQHHGPEVLLTSGIAMGLAEFMDFLTWLGEHADGLGILISAAGVFGGLWFTYRRNKILERNAK